MRELRRLLLPGESSDDAAGSPVGAPSAASNGKRERANNGDLVKEGYVHRGSSVWRLESDRVQLVRKVIHRLKLKA